ncbi:hypothetical protein IMCC21906_02581 [Spongiibacter sp. IMCC21906]|nr:hypothetical protein IMCC21906_02581 [Spongiibacter sp. IMCC21906]
MYFFEARVKLGSTEKEILVVFSGQLEGGELAYSQLIESGYQKFKNRPEEVIFVYPEYIKKAVTKIFIKDGQAYRNIVRYGDEIPVSLAPFDIRGDVVLESINQMSALTDDISSLRDQIVSKGVYSLARTRKDQVIQKAPSGTVFIKPSAKEYDEFIKASELAVGYAENQFVGFSLLSRAPRERDIRRIYIDTNSISSFIEALLYYWVKFTGAECKQATYHSYSSYGGKDKAKPEDSENVWLIISASRSNSMGIDMAADWKLENDQVITLLSYTPTQQGNVGDEILVNIASLSESAEREIVNGSLMKVKVWGENFTAEVEKPNPVHIRAEHKTPAISKLIVPNIQSGLIKLNRKVSADLAVNSVYFDCNEYLESDVKFLGWLDKVIDWYVPSKTSWLVYRGIDLASVTLADSIEKRMQANGIHSFTKIDISDAYKKIKGNEAVVVAMPVTGSGQTLLKLNRNLRISGHLGNRIFISPFVVSTSKSAFDQFRNSLIYGPNGMKYMFLSYKSVYIGHTDEENSWSQELKVVEHLDSDFWKHRASLLRNHKDGLKGAIGTPSLKIDERLSFTRDFAFWGTTNYDPKIIDHEAVYLTISSILQGLREKPYSNTDKDSLFSYVYQHAVLAPDNFTRLTDALLQSCLWRAANIREMDYRCLSA